MQNAELTALRQATGAALTASFSDRASRMDPTTFAAIAGLIPAMKPGTQAGEPVIDGSPSNHASDLPQDDGDANPDEKH